MDDLKAAARSLLATPGPTAVVILTLAIAIGANTAIFSVVDGVLLRPLGYGDDSRLVVLWSSIDDDTFRLSPADYMDVRDGADAFGGDVALTRYIGSTLTALEEPVRVGSMTVTPRLFRVLEATPALGRLFGAEDDTPGGDPKLVISHASWTRRFGADPDIVGTTIEVDGGPRTIIGVLEPDFAYPPGDDEIEIYFPMPLDNRVLPDRSHRMFDGIARLADGVTIDAARQELDAIAATLGREHPTTNDGWGLAAVPLRTELLGSLSTTLWVLSGAVFLVLLIACVGIANLLVARSVAAGREFAVRAALGAGGLDLCKRSLAESVILGLAGGSAGVLLALWGTAVLRTVVPGDIPRAGAIGVDGAALAFAVATTIGATLVFGSLPALRSMTPDVSRLLNAGSASTTGSAAASRLREAMVVAEVALAVVLLIAAGLMLRSFARVGEIDPGFRRADVVSVGVQLSPTSHRTAEWRPFFEQLVERVAALPGVQAAGAVSDLPMNSVGLGFELEFRVVGAEPLAQSARPNADVRLVIPGYFEAMGMEIVGGRAFDSRDAPDDRDVVIVNETVVNRYFRGIDPVGRTISLELGDFDIIGVVADIRHEGLLSRYESEIYLPYGRPTRTAEMHVVVHSDEEPRAVATAVNDVVREMDPQLAPSPSVSVSELLWESVARPRFNAALLAILAGCGAILAVVGTYGIVAYTVSQRAREIGVRMALGADAAATVSMIVRRAFRIVGTGAVLGVLGAVAASRYLAALLFEIQPIDPLTYLVVAGTAVGIGLLAAWTPARRATRIDPVAVLRDG